VLKIIDVHVAEIRFPISSHSDGSDAMNPDPDYSATYVTLITNSELKLKGGLFIT
jgi:L-fuconate dehydratase